MSTTDPPHASGAPHPRRWGAGVSEPTLSRPGWARRMLIAVTELTVHRESPYSFMRAPAAPTPRLTPPSEFSLAPPRG